VIWKLDAVPVSGKKNDATPVVTFIPIGLTIAYLKKKLWCSGSDQENYATSCGSGSGSVIVMPISTSFIVFIKIFPTICFLFVGKKVFRSLTTAKSKRVNENFYVNAL
jgi:hypothetical protein